MEASAFFEKTQAELVRVVQARAASCADADTLGRWLLGVLPAAPTADAVDKVLLAVHGCLSSRADLRRKFLDHADAATPGGAAVLALNVLGALAASNQRRAQPQASAAALAALFAADVFKDGRLMIMLGSQVPSARKGTAGVEASARPGERVRFSALACLQALTPSLLASRGPIRTGALQQLGRVMALPPRLVETTQTSAQGAASDALAVAQRASAAATPATETGSARAILGARVDRVLLGAHSLHMRGKPLADALVPAVASLSMSLRSPAEGIGARFAAAVLIALVLHHADSETAVLACRSALSETGTSVTPKGTPRGEGKKGGDGAGAQSPARVPRNAQHSGLYLLHRGRRTVEPAPAGHSSPRGTASASATPKIVEAGGAGRGGVRVGGGAARGSGRTGGQSGPPSRRPSEASASGLPVARSAGNARAWALVRFQDHAGGMESVGSSRRTLSFHQGSGVSRTMSFQGGVSSFRVAGNAGRRDGDPGHSKAWKSMGGGALANAVRIARSLSATVGPAGAKGSSTRGAGGGVKYRVSATGASAGGSAAAGRGGGGARGGAGGSDAPLSTAAETAAVAPSPARSTASAAESAGSAAERAASIVADAAPSLVLEAAVLAAVDDYVVEGGADHTARSSGVHEPVGVARARLPAGAVDTRPTQHVLFAQFMLLVSTALADAAHSGLTAATLRTLAGIASEADDLPWFLASPAGARMTASALTVMCAGPLCALMSRGATASEPRGMSASSGRSPSAREIDSAPVILLEAHNIADAGLFAPAEELAAAEALGTACVAQARPLLEAHIRFLDAHFGVLPTYHGMHDLAVSVARMLRRNVDDAPVWPPLLDEHASHGGDGDEADGVAATSNLRLRAALLKLVCFFADSRLDSAVDGPAVESDGASRAHSRAGSASRWRATTPSRSRPGTGSTLGSGTLVVRPSQGVLTFRVAFLEERGVQALIEVVKQSVDVETGDTTARSLRRAASAGPRASAAETRTLEETCLTGALEALCSFCVDTDAVDATMLEDSGAISAVTRVFADAADNIGNVAGAATPDKLDDARDVVLEMAGGIIVGALAADDDLAADFLAESALSNILRALGARLAGTTAAKSHDWPWPTIHSLLSAACSIAAGVGTGEDLMAGIEGLAPLVTVLEAATSLAANLRASGGVAMPRPDMRSTRSLASATGSTAASRDKVEHRFADTGLVDTLVDGAERGDWVLDDEAGSGQSARAVEALHVLGGFNGHGLHGDDRTYSLAVLLDHVSELACGLLSRIVSNKTGVALAMRAQPGRKRSPDDASTKATPAAAIKPGHELAGGDGGVRDLPIVTAAVLHVLNLVPAPAPAVLAHAVQCLAKLVDADQTLASRVAAPELLAVLSRVALNLGGDVEDAAVLGVVRLSHALAEHTELSGWSDRPMAGLLDMIGDSGAGAAVAGMLWTLCRRQSNRDWIAVFATAVKSSHVFRLVDMIGGRHKEGRWAAAGAIAELCDSNDKMAAAFTDRGAVLSVIRAIGRAVCAWPRVADGSAEDSAPTRPSTSRSHESATKSSARGYETAVAVVEFTRCLRWLWPAYVQSSGGDEGVDPEVLSALTRLLTDGYFDYLISSLDPENWNRGNINHPPNEYSARVCTGLLAELVCWDTDMDVFARWGADSRTVFSSKKRFQRGTGALEGKPKPASKAGTLAADAAGSASVSAGAPHTDDSSSKARFAKAGSVLACSAASLARDSLEIKLPGQLLALATSPLTSKTLQQAAFRCLRRLATELNGDVGRLDSDDSLTERDAGGATSPSRSVSPVRSRSPSRARSRSRGRSVGRSPRRPDNGGVSEDGASGHASAVATSEPRTHATKPSATDSHSDTGAGTGSGAGSGSRGGRGDSGSGASGASGRSIRVGATAEWVDAVLEFLHDEHTRLDAAGTLAALCRQPSRAREVAELDGCMEDIADALVTGEHATHRVREQDPIAAGLGLGSAHDAGGRRGRRSSSHKHAHYASLFKAAAAAAGGDTVETDPRFAPAPRSSSFVYGEAFASALGLGDTDQAGLEVLGATGHVRGSDSRAALAGWFFADSNLADASRARATSTARPGVTASASVGSAESTTRALLLQTMVKLAFSNGEPRTPEREIVRSVIGVLRAGDSVVLEPSQMFAVALLWSWTAAGYDVEAACAADEVPDSYTRPGKTLWSSMLALLGARSRMAGSGRKSSPLSADCQRELNDLAAVVWRKMRIDAHTLEFLDKALTHADPCVSQVAAEVVFDLLRVPQARTEILDPLTRLELRGWANHCMLAYWSESRTSGLTGLLGDSPDAIVVADVLRRIALHDGNHSMMARDISASHPDTRSHEDVVAGSEKFDGHAAGPVAAQVQRSKLLDLVPLISSESPAVVAAAALAIAQLSERQADVACVFAAHSALLDRITAALKRSLAPATAGAAASGDAIASAGAASGVAPTPSGGAGRPPPRPTPSGKHSARDGKPTGLRRGASDGALSAHDGAAKSIGSGSKGSGSMVSGNSNRSALRPTPLTLSEFESAHGPAGPSSLGAAASSAQSSPLRVNGDASKALDALTVLLLALWKVEPIMAALSRSPPFHAVCRSHYVRYLVQCVDTEPRRAVGSGVGAGFGAVAARMMRMRQQLMSMLRHGDRGTLSMRMLAELLCWRDDVDLVHAYLSGRDGGAAWQLGAPEVPRDRGAKRRGLGTDGRHQTAQAHRAAEDDVDEILGGVFKPRARRTDRQLAMLAEDLGLSRALARIMLSSTYRVSKQLAAARLLRRHAASLGERVGLAIMDPTADAPEAEKGLQVGVGAIAPDAPGLRDGVPVSPQGPFGRSVVAPHTVPDADVTSSPLSGSGSGNSRFTSQALLGLLGKRHLRLDVSIALVVLSSHAAVARVMCSQTSGVQLLTSALAPERMETLAPRWLSRTSREHASAIAITHILQTLLTMSVTDQGSSTVVVGPEGSIVLPDNHSSTSSKLRVHPQDARAVAMVAALPFNGSDDARVTAARSRNQALAVAVLWSWARTAPDAVLSPYVGEQTTSFAKQRMAAAGVAADVTTRTRTAARRHSSEHDPSSVGPDSADESPLMDSGLDESWFADGGSLSRPLLELLACDRQGRRRSSGAVKKDTDQLSADAAADAVWAHTLADPGISSPLSPGRATRFLANFRVGASLRSLPGIGSSMRSLLSNLGGSTASLTTDDETRPTARDTGVSTSRPGVSVLRGGKQLSSGAPAGQVSIAARTGNAAHAQLPRGSDSASRSGVHSLLPALRLLRAHPLPAVRRTADRALLLLSMSEHGWQHLLTNQCAKIEPGSSTAAWSSRWCLDPSFRASVAHLVRIIASQRDADVSAQAASVLAWLLSNQRNTAVIADLIAERELDSMMPTLVHALGTASVAVRKAVATCISTLCFNDMRVASLTAHALLPSPWFHGATDVATGLRWLLGSRGLPPSALEVPTRLSTPTRSRASSPQHSPALSHAGSTEAVRRYDSDNEDVLPRSADGGAKPNQKRGCAALGACDSYCSACFTPATWPTRARASFRRVKAAIVMAGDDRHELQDGDTGDEAFQRLLWLLDYFASSNESEAVNAARGLAFTLACAPAADMKPPSAPEPAPSRDSKTVDPFEQASKPLLARDGGEGDARTVAAGGALAQRWRLLRLFREWCVTGPADRCALAASWVLTHQPEDPLRSGAVEAKRWALGALSEVLVNRSVPGWELRALAAAQRGIYGAVRATMSWSSAALRDIHKELERRRAEAGQRGMEGLSGGAGKNMRKSASHRKLLESTVGTVDESDELAFLHREPTPTAADRSEAGAPEAGPAPSAARHHAGSSKVVPVSTEGDDTDRKRELAAPARGPGTGGRASPTVVLAAGFRRADAKAMPRSSDEAKERVPRVFRFQEGRAHARVATGLARNSPHSSSHASLSSNSSSNGAASGAYRETDSPWDRSTAELADAGHSLCRVRTECMWILVTDMSAWLAGHTQRGKIVSVRELMAEADYMGCLNALRKLRMALNDSADVKLTPHASELVAAALGPPVPLMLASTTAWLLKGPSRSRPGSRQGSGEGADGSAGTGSWEYDADSMLAAHVTYAASFDRVALGLRALITTSSSAHSAAASRLLWAHREWDTWDLLRLPLYFTVLMSHAVPMGARLAADTLAQTGLPVSHHALRAPKLSGLDAVDVLRAVLSVQDKVALHSALQSWFPHRTISHERFSEFLSAAERLVAATEAAIAAPKRGRASRASPSKVAAVSRPAGYGLMPGRLDTEAQRTAATMAIIGDELFIAMRQLLGAHHNLIHYEFEGHVGRRDMADATAVLYACPHHLRRDAVWDFLEDHPLLGTAFASMMSVAVACSLWRLPDMMRHVLGFASEVHGVRVPAIVQALTQCCTWRPDPASLALQLMSPADAGVAGFESPTIRAKRHLMEVPVVKSGMERGVVQPRGGPSVPAPTVNMRALQLKTHSSALSTHSELNERILEAGEEKSKSPKSRSKPERGLTASGSHTHTSMATGESYLSLHSLLARTGAVAGHADTRDRAQDGMGGIALAGGVGSGQGALPWLEFRGASVHRNLRTVAWVWFRATVDDLAWAFGARAFATGLSPRSSVLAAYVLLVAPAVFLGVVARCTADEWSGWPLSAQEAATRAGLGIYCSLLGLLLCRAAITARLEPAWARMKRADGLAMVAPDDINGMVARKSAGAVSDSLALMDDAARGSVMPVVGSAPLVVVRWGEPLHLLELCFMCVEFYLLASLAFPGRRPGSRGVAGKAYPAEFYVVDFFAAGAMWGLPASHALWTPLIAVLAASTLACYRAVPRLREALSVILGVAPRPSLATVVRSTESLLGGCDTVVPTTADKYRRALKHVGAAPNVEMPSSPKAPGGFANSTPPAYASEMRKAKPSAVLTYAVTSPSSDGRQRFFAGAPEERRPSCLDSKACQAVLRAWSAFHRAGARALLAVPSILTGPLFMTVLTAALRSAQCVTPDAVSDTTGTCTSGLCSSMEPGLPCFGQQHLIHAAVCLLALGLYVPAATLAPLQCLGSPKRNVIATTYSRYAVVASQLGKALLTTLSVLMDHGERTESTVWTVTYLGIAATVLALLAVHMAITRPCGVAVVNRVRAAYIGCCSGLCITSAAAVLLGDPASSSPVAPGAVVAVLVALCIFVVAQCVKRR